jgi:hypothetical protein
MAEAAPLPEAVEEFNVPLLRLGLITGVSTGITLSISYSASRHVGRLTRALLQAMEKIEDGNVSTRLESTAETASAT